MVLNQIIVKLMFKKKYMNKKEFFKKMLLEINEESTQDYIKSDVNEINPKTLSALATSGSKLRAAFEEIAIFSKTEGKPITRMELLQNGKLNTKTAIPLNNADEIVTALKEGALKPAELARLHSGLLLQSKPLPQNIIDDIVRDLIESKKFTSKYAKMSPKELKDALKGKYSKQASDAILAQTKTNPIFKNAVGKYQQKPAAPPSKPGPGPEAGYLDDAIKQALANGDKEAAKRLQEIQKQLTNMPQQGKNKIPWGQMSTKQKFLYGGKIAVAGAGAYFLYRSIWGNNTINTDDPQNDVLPECVLNLSDDDGASFETTSDGILVLKVTKTGNEEYDRNGGLIFYPNGTVRYANDKRKGTYTCKETSEGSELEIQNESIQELNEIKNRFKSIIYYKQDILTEQAEITQAQMSSYVSKAISDIDGWVDNKDLQSVLGILKSLKGKTYKGNNALQYFMNYYQQIEGENFIDDINSVGIRTLGVPGIETKNEILSLVQTATPQEVPDGGDQNKSTGVGGIDFNWDDQKPAPKPEPQPQPVVPPKQEQEFKFCFDFPLKQYCISTKIGEIQNCFKQKWNNKYDTNFEQFLINKTKELGYPWNPSEGLNAKLYQFLMDTCKAGQVQQQPEPEQQQNVQEPLPITPPATPEEPVYDKNRLNELLASNNLVMKRNGTIVKWKGEQLNGNDYFILNKYLIDQGYIQKKQREIGDKDDEDVQMKYKWKKMEQK